MADLLHGLLVSVQTSVPPEVPRDEHRSLRGLLSVCPQWANYQVFICKSLVSEEKYPQKLD